MWEFFLNNSPLVFIGYILIKETSPLIKNALDRVIPSRIERVKRRDDATHENEAREIDIKERELIVMEQLAKSNILISERLTEVNKSLDALMFSQTTVNTSLSVLLDRARLYRSEDTRPLNVIKRAKRTPKKK
jgi:hypothetical protein